MSADIGAERKLLSVVSHLHECAETDENFYAIIGNETWIYTWL
jgi:hypothetical protein